MLGRFKDGGRRNRDDGDCLAVRSEHLELAGGMVMSLMTRRGRGLGIAVTSNMAHANTSSLALRVGDAFAEQTRSSR